MLKLLCSSGRRAPSGRTLARARSDSDPVRTSGIITRHGSLVHSTVRSFVRRGGGGVFRSVCQTDLFRAGGGDAREGAAGSIYPHRFIFKFPRSSLPGSRIESDCSRASAGSDQITAEARLMPTLMRDLEEGLSEILHSPAIFSPLCRLNEQTVMLYGRPARGRNSSQ